MLFPRPAARRVVAACVGLSALPAPSPGQAGQAAPPPILEITTVTRVVDVYATVKDARGRLVTSLGRDQFELREDGVRQQVDYFAHETDAPLSLGLVIDTSASQAQLLPTEREKARAFLRAVLGASDRAFVMRFDQEVVLLQGLTARMPSSHARSTRSTPMRAPPRARLTHPRAVGREAPASTTRSSRRVSS